MQRFHPLIYTFAGLLTVNPDERLTVDDLINHAWFRRENETPETPLATPSVLTLASQACTLRSPLGDKVALLL